MEGEYNFKVSTPFILYRKHIYFNNNSAYKAKE